MDFDEEDLEDELEEVEDGLGFLYRVVDRSGREFFVLACSIAEALKEYRDWGRRNGQELEDPVEVAEAGCVIIPEPIHPESN